MQAHQTVPGSGDQGLEMLGIKSDLAVLQVGVDVFDEGVVRVTGGEGQLTQGTAPSSTLL